MKAHGTYTVKKWDEKPYEEIPPTARLTKASVEYEIAGEIEGNALVEYLMYYSHFDSKDQHNSSAVYVGLIRFVGKLNGKSGSVVFHDDGSFKAGAASSVLKIIADSGTGAFKGIRGSGKYLADMSGLAIDVDYELP